MDTSHSLHQVQQNAVTRFAGKRTLDALELAMSEALGDKYINYRRRWTASSRDFIPPYPLHLDFELNDTCNQSCIMCPRNTETHLNTDYKINTRIFFSLELFQNIIDEAVANGLTSINLGAFAEPLIHPEFRKFVEYAKTKGILDIRIITNGLRLDDFVDFLVDMSVTNVYVSLDALNEHSYRSIRGSGFERVESNLRKLINERNKRAALFPVIRVSFVKMAINASEEAGFIDKWRNFVDYIDIQPGEDLSHSPDTLLNADYRFKCIAPWQRLSILASGDIIPCCSFYGRYLPIGNIKETSVLDAWNSAAMQAVRKGLIDASQNVCEICQKSLLS
jgi:radical SAM protein with 4Fe4S-binding SPASM domain